jgi:ribosomal protein L33
MDKQRYYTWELNNKNYNEILIFEQEQEDENSYDCISHIIEQLLQENHQYKFHLKKYDKQLNK